MELPPQTEKIFEWLSKGLFINSHSANLEQEDLYKVIEKHFEVLKAYFSPLGFQLEKGEKYFYLSRRESKSNLEDKLVKLSKYIDSIDFLMSYDPYFGVGTRVNIEGIVQACKEDILLRRKFQKLDFRGENLFDKIKRMLDMMTKEHFLDVEDESQKSYRVLHAFHYLEDIILSIQAEEI